jgi:1,4-dihydroxy-2-naphthoate octaprenyltransferase
MATLKDFYLGARPKTLSAALVPVAIGGALAYMAEDARPKYYPAAVGYGPSENPELYDRGITLACLIVAIALQIGVNYANDYSDGIKGTDDNRAGPMRLVGSGVANPTSVLKAMIFSFVIAGIAGIYVASQSSWWLIAVGAVCIALAWFYTGGKHPYGYYGYGEIVVFICFGLVATVGTYYANTLEITYEAVVGSFIPGFFSVAILLANNIRDIPTDKMSHKKTLATRIGRKRAEILFNACVAMIALSIIALGVSIPLVLVGLIPLVIMIPVMRTLRIATRPPEYISVLVRTSKANLLVGMTVALFIVVSVLR